MGIGGLIYGILFGEGIVQLHILYVQEPKVGDGDKWWWKEGVGRFGVGLDGLKLFWSYFWDGWCGWIIDLILMIRQKLEMVG